MKRALKWVGLVVLLLVIAVGAVWFTAFGHNSPIVDAQQLAPGVETVKDGFVSIFMVDGARVYALDSELPLIGDKVKVTHPVKDGDVVDLGGLRVEAFAVPGHTPGSAVFLARGVLFFGDSAGASKDGAMMKAVSLFSKDPGQNVASLKALEARLLSRASEVKELAFAHTGPLEGFQPFATFASLQN